MAVDVIYSPIKTLVLHDVIETDRDEILRRAMTPSGSMPLFWCNGVLISFTSMPPTKEVIKDYLEGGKIHWMEVRYTEMKTYQSVLELHEEQFLKSRVIDTSDNEVHTSFVKWLKSRKR